MQHETIEPASGTSRLLSLDTLRGFDMFWIIGGDAFCRRLADVTDWGWADALGTQMTHVKWEGLRAYDLVFPLFMFISGVAVPYAFASRFKRGATKPELVRRALVRAVILIVLGLIFNRNLDFDPERFRVVSVLGQIGLAYFFAALIVLYGGGFRARCAWLVLGLSGYAAVQWLVPVPGVGAGVLTPEGVINGYLDRLLLPGRLYGGVYDPLGILCIVSATWITLMGTLAGSVLRDGKGGGGRKAATLGAAGLVMLSIGLAVAPWYPPIKSAWTTTFNLQAGGISLLLLALFYLVIDVWGFTRWTYFFHVIGVNALAIYFGQRIVNFGSASAFLFTGTASLAGAYGSLVLVMGSTSLKWLCLWFMDRKNIYWKV